MPVRRSRPRQRGRTHEALAKYLHELGQLKRVRRSGWWLAGVRDPESVAEHSFRVVAVAYFLARMEGADVAKTLAMAVFHDAAEARVNDPHRLAREYIEWSGVEAEVIDDQLRGLPGRLALDLRSLLGEGRDKKTLEACIVKDADRLECLLQAREYAEQGYPVREWVDSSVRELSTDAAKTLARAILRISPGSWRSSASAVDRHPR